MKKNWSGKIFNLSRSLHLKGVPLLPKLLWMANRVVFSCDLPYTADIDPSVTFAHNGLGVVINGKCRIGANTLILQNVTLGGNMGKKKEFEGQMISSPMIGNNVIIGAGAKILGPVSIGNNSKIGAGAVVLQDVPENSVAIGIPAKIVNYNA